VGVVVVVGAVVVGVRLEGAGIAVAVGLVGDVVVAA